MFIIEGLVYYLPPEAFKASLTGISETAVAGSRLFFDFLHLDALSNEITMPGLETLLVVSGWLFRLHWSVYRLNDTCYLAAGVLMVYAAAGDC
jgi:O-methyltransferase involved in polyketide biosynthesis